MQISGNSWDDPDSPVVAALTDAAGSYRDRYRADPSGVAIMPAWAYPAGMSHDEFRASAEAVYARRLGFRSVEWVDRRGVLVRRVQL